MSSAQTEQERGMKTASVSQIIDGLDAAIRDIECPVQFTPLLMSARRALVRSEWRDISSAPKDGTRILVFRRVDPWNVVGTAEWVDVAGVAGWLSRGVSDPPGDLGLAAPTHWMPIPTPPTEGQS